MVSCRDAANLSNPTGSAARTETCHEAVGQSEEADYDGGEESSPVGQRIDQLVFNMHSSAPWHE
jgi:hypothetical protein